jgi:orotidine-5'-phosphate decarboxylase
MNARDRLIVALDVPTPDEALHLVDRLAGAVGMFKVGSQLFTVAGPGLVKELVARQQNVFLDLKYHDIPNTVAAAVAVAAKLGVTLVDVHGLGGRAMIEAAATALPNLGTRLLAITVLTSHDAAWLGQVGMSRRIPDAVRRLALLARDAGAHGVVASPHEIALVRETCGPEFLIVTPGIRPAGAEAGDQSRAATPATAIGAGADYIVVGRPILAAPDPVAAAEAIVAEMDVALVQRGAPVAPSVHDGPSVVLIVDDDPSVIGLVRSIMHAVGIRVESASDGDEGVAKALRVTPDVILMDLAMPRVDGFTATRQIRADARTAHIPVVAVTGYHWEEEQARREGFFSLVHKPYQPEQLVAAVRRALQRR